MEVSKLVAIIDSVCGLSENWAKACIYYCMATHYMQQIDWMPVLDIVAEKGSGKTQLISILRKVCYMPYDIICYDKITSVTLRNELIKASGRTAIIEEVDTHPNRRELERYLINRVDKKHTASLATTHQVAVGGAVLWKTDTLNVFGATILHDRHELSDMAADRRSIKININKQKGRQFFKPDEAFLSSIQTPASAFGIVPELFNSQDTTGSALDTWEPLIRIANGVGDEDWLYWAWVEIVDMDDALTNAQQWEIEHVILGAVVKAYCDRNRGQLDENNIKNVPLPLTSVTEAVRKQYAWVQPKTISTKLKRLGFKDIL